HPVCDRLHRVSESWLRRIAGAAIRRNARLRGALGPGREPLLPEVDGMPPVVVPARIDERAAVRAPELLLQRDARWVRQRHARGRGAEAVARELVEQLLVEQCADAAAAGCIGDVDSDLAGPLVRGTVVPRAGLRITDHAAFVGDKPRIASADTPRRAQ